MKILAIDVGHGTQDVFLYDSAKKYENSIKLILPSPSRLYASRVREMEGDLFVKGLQVGGGELSSELLNHEGSVYMTKKTASTIRNDPDDVMARGIEIVEIEPPRFRGSTLEIHEPSLIEIKKILEDFGENIDEIDAIAIAVQDHGSYLKGESNRKARMSRLRGILEKRHSVQDLLFSSCEIPEEFSRMHDAYDFARSMFQRSELFVMDTSPAAILGCMGDARAGENTLAINIGNGHTMAALFSGSTISAIFEHHTRKLTHDKLRDLIRRFVHGDLEDEEVFNDGGHGCFYLSEVREPESLLITGPNRGLIEGTGLRFSYAYPAGDVMLPGPIGMIGAVLDRMR